MTEAEWQELIDLYLDNALPEILRARVDAHIAAQPSVAGDVLSQQDALTRLRTAPLERPQAWYVEHVLDSLLRDHASATPYDQLVNEANQ